MLNGRLRAAILGPGLAAALALAACGGDSGSGDRSSRSRTSALPPPTCGTYSGRGCAPASQRVDLVKPSFSNSTKITNPLFPISRLRSALLLGQVEGAPLRVETTLLPGSKTITWNGERIRVRISQYVAYLHGRIEEVAIDRYAQADDGSVWYLGEDVLNYKDGVVANMEGTWLAGREGPPAMIMPAKPKVGDVFAPENIPAIIYEEVTVKSVGRTVAGPRGHVQGAIVTDELHLDGSREHKTFAPGYGEFSTGSGADVEALALAVPTDALPGPPPAQLAALSTSAAALLESVRAGEREAAAAIVKRMSADWNALRARTQPPMVAARMSDALTALTRAVTARKSALAAQAAIDVAQSALDLQLRHRPPAEIDASRFALRAQQLRVHAAANDLAGATGDVAVLEWIRDRFAHTVRPAERRELDSRLRALRAATDARNLPAAADHAARLAARVRVLAAPRPAR